MHDKQITTILVNTVLPEPECPCSEIFLRTSLTLKKERIS